MQLHAPIRAVAEVMPPYLVRGNPFTVAGMIVLRVRRSAGLAFFFMLVRLDRLDLLTQLLNLLLLGMELVLQLVERDLQGNIVMLQGSDLTM